MFAKRREEAFKNRRNAARQDHAEMCIINVDQRSFRANTQDISATGMRAMLRSVGTVKPGSPVQIFLGSLKPLTGTVRWARERAIGIQFDIGAESNAELKKYLDELNEDDEGKEDAQ